MPNKHVSYPTCVVCLGDVEDMPKCPACHGKGHETCDTCGAPVSDKFTETPFACGTHNPRVVKGVKRTQMCWYAASQIWNLKEILLLCYASLAQHARTCEERDCFRCEAFNQAGLEIL